MPTGDCKSVDSLSIPQNMIYISEQLGRLMNNITDIEARLSKILSKENEVKADVCDKPEKLRCDHAQELFSYCNTLVVSNERLENILDRLEL